MEFTTAKVIIIMQTTKQNGGKSDVLPAFSWLYKKISLFLQR